MQNESKTQLELKNHIEQLENNLESLRVEFSLTKNQNHSLKSDIELLQSKYNDLNQINADLMNEKNESETQ